MVQSNTVSQTHLTGNRTSLVLISAFVAVLAMWFIVCLISRNPGALALSQFLVLSVAMVLCTVGVVWHYHLNDIQISFRWVFISALILRLVSLIGEPLFEDDYFRYLWDGLQTATTNDPYTLAPAIFFDRDVPDLFEPILSFINYPDIATVYGPVVQWFFAIGYFIAPAKIWPLQLLAGMADLVILFLLFKLGAGKALLFYAWSPLLLKEFSLTAHPDIYGVLGLMLSVYAVYRHHAVLGGIAIALACGAKVFAILAVPYLLTRTVSIRFWGRFVNAFAVSIAAITAAFGSIRIWAPEGLIAMAESWLFNAPLYFLLLNFLEFQVIKLLLLSAFTTYGFIAFLRRLIRIQNTHNDTTLTCKWHSSSAAFRGDYLYGLFLLALPVLNPWYVVWLLPFAVLYPSLWAWTTSVAVLLSYWYGINIGTTAALPFDQPHWSLIAVEYATIIVVTLIAWRIVDYQSKRRPCAPNKKNQA